MKSSKNMHFHSGLSEDQIKIQIPEIIPSQKEWICIKDSINSFCQVRRVKIPRLNGSIWLFFTSFFTLLTQKNIGQMVNKEKILLSPAKKEPDFFALGGKNSIFSSWTKSDFFLGPAGKNWVFTPWSKKIRFFFS